MRFQLKVVVKIADEHRNSFKINKETSTLEWITLKKLFKTVKYHKIKSQVRVLKCSLQPTAYELLGK